MIRTFGEHRAFIGVASARRPQNVKLVEEKFGPVTWFVPEPEIDEYVSQGATRVERGSGENVSGAYNAVLMFGWSLDLPSICLNDDPVGDALLADCEGGSTRISHSQGLAVILERLMKSDYYFGGSSKTNNPFWVKKATDTMHFISGCLQVVKPCRLLHDESLRIFGDLDYWLQHIEQMGGTIRCNDVIMPFAFLQEGGLSAIRMSTDDKRYHHPEDPVALADSERLVEKWGSLITFKDGERTRPYPKRFSRKGDL